MIAFSNHLEAAHAAWAVTAASSLATATACSRARLMSQHLAAAVVAFGYLKPADGLAGVLQAAGCSSKPTASWLYRNAASLHASARFDPVLEVQPCAAALGGEHTEAG